MNAARSELLQAFREDHAVLGRGVYEISLHLRSGDFAEAKAAAERVDREAGAHIALEETFFYPVLRRLLGTATVDRLYHEHGEGLAVIKALAALPAGVRPGAAERDRLLRQVELMEAHVAECGEMFGGIGRIAPEEQARLYRALLDLRRQGPRWSAVTAKPLLKAGDG